ncbi:MAG: phenylacetic acid degradation bifunctional protein PaaZ, partial [Bacteroidetes bacterium]|nr:phenylacetic acid degradation bifunctional protein PaaZ [Bacteroidota bacterium]
MLTSLKTVPEKTGTRTLKNFICGEWIAGMQPHTTLFNAITGEEIAATSTNGIDFGQALEYGRNAGGPALRKLTFHERARMLKNLAVYLNEKKSLFYDLSWATGATKADSWIDIEGGIGNLFVYAGKGRRELPDKVFYVDGNPEIVSKGGSFIGQHICLPLEGIAVHINAFNFPCWGMLEKIAVNLLAGVPAIVKPATVTSYLTELMFRKIIESGILPAGSLQLICGSAGDLLDHLICQDVVTFTGSAETGKKLKSHPAVIENSVRFTMEADSLNFCLLGSDAEPGREEFNLFIKEVAKEMTVKAGQKCTAIRRTIVPQKFLEPVVNALKKRLSEIKTGDPQVQGVRMGSLAGMQQVKEVSYNTEKLMNDCVRVFGDYDSFELLGADKKKGAFFPSMILLCEDPFRRKAPHEVEAFGPVTTVIPYKSAEEAVELIKMGRGSLCGSVFTEDDRFAREIVLGTGAWHGRIVVINPSCSGESTGHGSPLPHLVHGGPGRAGGGEEMGGIRGVLQYMQRVALQGSPATLSRICEVYLPKAEQKTGSVHPFCKYFEELEIGDTIITHKRTVTEADIS